MHIFTAMFLVVRLLVRSFVRSFGPSIPIFSLFFENRRFLLLLFPYLDSSIHLPFNRTECVRLCVRSNFFPTQIIKVSNMLFLIFINLISSVYCYIASNAMNMSLFACVPNEF